MKQHFEQIASVCLGAVRAQKQTEVSDYIDLRRSRKRCITHGYDALRPSNRYVAKIAEALEAEEINKGNRRGSDGSEAGVQCAFCKDCRAFPQGAD